MANTSGNKAFLLRCAVQQYAWGKIGKASAVATLTKSACPPFVIEEEKPYAELWMGTHVNGPNYVVGTDKKLLSQWLQENPSAIGEKVKGMFPAPGELPYLLKVLSVNKALSIQAHPNKKHAEELHAKMPKEYKDPNHKPEMAIALTRFEALCGFRPKSEIVAFMKDVPEFGSILGATRVEAFEKANSPSDEVSALRECFTALMTTDPETIKTKLAELVSRLQDAANKGQDTSKFLGELLLRLNSQFPGDVGCFNIYFLNYMTLNPGDAIFLEANLPHAYLSGDCIECMACSDNVVRAGLTPKFKDVDTLCSMLNYTCRSAQENLFSPKKQDDNVTVFSPPVPDFAVDKIEVANTSSNYSMGAMDSASICLTIQGEAEVPNNNIKLVRGSVLFVPANSSIEIKPTSALLIFRAYCST